MLFEELSSSEVNVYLLSPPGNYDRLDLELHLLYTNSLQYFVDKNQTRDECAENMTYFASISSKQNGVKDPIRLAGLCPMSFFNGTVRTVREGFESAMSFSLYRTSTLKTPFLWAIILSKSNSNSFPSKLTIMSIVTWLLWKRLAKGSKLLGPTPVCSSITTISHSLITWG